MKTKGVYKRKDGRWEARYQKGINESGRAVYGAVYATTEEEVIEKRRLLLEEMNGPASAPTELNLLILGAGTHGRDVKEIAESLHIFGKIDFLDDKLDEGILGTCKDVLRYKQEYPCAFIAIGDNKARKKYAKLLDDYKFLIPRLVSPAANVSPAARIGKGTVILPQVTVGDAEVGDYCILSSNSLVNSKSEVKNFTHIGCGGIVLKGSKVPEMTVVKSGEVFRRNT